jgi:hypothetical protein
MSDFVRDLCRELPTLYAQLGAELGAQRLDDGPDRSTPGGNAGALIAGTVIATVTRTTGLTRRGVPGSAAPLDIAVLGAQEDIWTALDALVADLRWARRLPHREGIWSIEALSLVLPLMEGLDEEQRASRWLTLGLRRLADARDGARRVLGLDERLLTLGECPSRILEDYPAAWDDDGYTPVAVWDDGLCRRYDPAASGRESRLGAPVDVWRRSHLVVDPTAGTASPAGDVRCVGCGRRWAGDEGRAQLGELLGTLHKAALLTATEIERVYLVPASTIRDYVAAGAIVPADEDERPARYVVAEVLAERARRRDTVASWRVA